MGIQKNLCRHSHEHFWTPLLLGVRWCPAALRVPFNNKWIRIFLFSIKNIPKSKTDLKKVMRMNVPDHHHVLEVPAFLLDPILIEQSHPVNPKIASYDYLGTWRSVVMQKFRGHLEKQGHGQGCTQRTYKILTAGILEPTQFKYTISPAFMLRSSFESFSLFSQPTVWICMFSHWIPFILSYLK